MVLEKKRIDLMTRIIGHLLHTDNTIKSLHFWSLNCSSALDTASDGSNMRDIVFSANDSAGLQNKRNIL